MQPRYTLECCLIYGLDCIEIMAAGKRVLDLFRRLRDNLGGRRRERERAKREIVRRNAEIALPKLRTQQAKLIDKKEGLGEEWRKNPDDPAITSEFNKVAKELQKTEKEIMAILKLLRLGEKPK